MGTNGRAGIGLIGCGVISEIYLKNLTSWDDVQVVAVADLMMERAEQRAQQFGIRAETVDALLADPEIDIVINLTIPAAHATVGRAVIEAGKSLYTEKPLATVREDGKALVDLAKERGLRIGGAPDTFLGGGLQMCRKLIDEGAIGEPLGATAFMLASGPESWHPAPEFFYLSGGGPMLDMGPYYITALVTLLGGVQRVTGTNRATYAERTVTSKKENIRQIPVEVPTHVTGLLDFASGAIATMIMSFDVWGSEHPKLEIYGTRGTLSLPDPNTFHGPVRLLKAGSDVWEEQPITLGFTENSRGIGVRDMARAIREGGPHLADGALTYHVLDVMQSIIEASELGRHVAIESSYERPAPLKPFGDLVVAGAR